MFEFSGNCVSVNVQGSYGNLMSKNDTRPAYCRTLVTYEPSKWPSSPRVSRSSVVRAPNGYLGGNGLDSRGDSDFFFVPRS